MYKIAIIGKPAGGKSTLGEQLSAAKGIPLHALDSIEFKKNGDRINPMKFNEIHQKILISESWIIEGFGTMISFNDRISAADTIIYIDLPYIWHYLWVTKRFFKGLFFTPKGWPEGSSIVKGTINSYKTLRLCPQFWNDQFLDQLTKHTLNKKLYVIKTVKALNNFVCENSEK